MTAIKQVAITSKAHMASLVGYLDRSSEKHEALDLDSQNLNNPDNWAEEMERTREAFGHNEPGKKGSKCTYMYHQIIGFNPDECDVNGGKLSKNDCMAFAREWVETYYPNQEAAWALHLEHSKDGTDRYAVHIAINRTNIETGRRLDEGRASRQKTLHAARMREMDEKHGLRQMERGHRNSRCHARQQSRSEQRARNAAQRSNPRFETDLDHVRRVVRECVREVEASGAPNKMRALNEALEARGVHMRMSRDGQSAKDVVFEYRPTYRRTDPKGSRIERASIRGHKLGRGFSFGGIQHGLGLVGGAAKAMASVAEAAMDDRGDSTI